MTQSPRALQAAFHPIHTVPTILNVTATAAAIAIADSDGDGAGGGPVRRIHVVNTSSATLAGIVWALKSSSSATKITGQTIANATQIPGGTSADFLVDATLSIGYVGDTATLSITISEV